jgi:hypothetical protein
VGTEISLDIGGLSIDWSKNARGADHGALFQEIDRKRLKSDQIDYGYFVESREDPGPMEMAFARRLKDVVPRLELLGFTLEAAHSEYLEVVEAHLQERDGVHEEHSEPAPNLMSFEEFCAFTTEHPIQSLDDTFTATVDDRNDNRVRGRFSDESVTGRVPGFSSRERHAYSEQSYLGLSLASCIRTLFCVSWPATGRICRPT